MSLLPSRSSNKIKEEELFEKNIFPFKVVIVFAEENEKKKKKLYVSAKMS